MDPLASPTTPAEPAPRERPTWLHPLLITVLAGIVLIGLGQVVAFFTLVGDLPGELVAPLLFTTFGAIAVGVGFAFAGAVMNGLAPGIRAAFLLGGAVFIGTAGQLGSMAATLGMLSIFGM